jgi:hypothetical protein
LYQSGSKMIRWTYSRNMKVPERINYAIPIDVWDTDWILEHMTREGLENNPPHKYDIPPFQFESLLLPEDKVSGVEGYEEFGRVKPVHYIVKVPPYPHVLTENIFLLMNPLCLPVSVSITKDQRAHQGYFGGGFLGSDG